MTARPAIEIALLAGGRGTRLGGVLKPLVEVAGRSILDRQLDVLLPLGMPVLVVAADPAPFISRGLRVVPDLRPGLGPLAGIESALAHAMGEYVLVIAGDLPALRPALLALLLDTAPGAPALVPVCANGPEPLLARYARALLPEVSARLDAGRLAPRDLAALPGAVLLDESCLRAADPDLASFENVNTPADLARTAARFLVAAP